MSEIVFYTSADQNHLGAYWSPAPPPITVIQAAIADVTGGPSSQFVTVAPHGFTTGMSVTITNVQGMTGVNGSWNVGVIDPFTFSIPNGETTGSFVPFSGGTAQSVTSAPPAGLVGGWMMYGGQSFLQATR